MKGTRRRLRQAQKEDRGASLVEYALMVALIAMVCIAAVTQLGGAASDEFTTAGADLASTSPTPANTCSGSWPDEHYIASDPGSPYRGVPMNWSGPGWYDGGPSYDRC